MEDPGHGNWHEMHDLAAEPRRPQPLVTGAMPELSFELLERGDLLRWDEQLLVDRLGAVLLEAARL
eukprot:4384623-Lingulodinium_polyedra.AAC.2